jgi:hypothetical protein
VLYTPGARGAAQRVARRESIAVVAPLGPGRRALAGADADVVVVLGADAANPKLARPGRSDP